MDENGEAYRDSLMAELTSKSRNVSEGPYFSSKEGDVKIYGVHLLGDSETEITEGKAALLDRISQEGANSERFKIRLVRAWDVLNRKAIVRLDAVEVEA